MAGKTLTTKRGTVLPLANLKGKEYLLVAHRIVWFAEENSSYKTEVLLPSVSEEATLAQVTVSILNDSGAVVKQVTDMKREHKVDFKDHTEKAITGALGRCMAQLGYGTAFALADLDEGVRIVDAPVIDVKKANSIAPIEAKVTLAESGHTSTQADLPLVLTEISKGSSFRKPRKVFAVPSEVTDAGNGGGWE